MILNKFTYFYPEKPFLITFNQPLFEKINSSSDWVAEKKYNGTRLLLHYYKGLFQFWNRHGEQIRFRPSEELQEELFKLSLDGYYVFDGELRHNKVKGIQNKIVIFDIHVLANSVLIKVPFSERRKILENLFPNNDILGLTQQYKTIDFEDTFNRVIVDEEIEGLVFKNLNGILNLGRSSGIDSTWMYKVRKSSKNYKF